MPIAGRMREKTTGEWIALLESVGVPCGPINRLDQVYADPQVRHRGMKIDVPHPLSGTVPLVANPIRFSRTPRIVRRAAAAPRRTHGRSAAWPPRQDPDEIAGLRAENVI